MTSCIKLESCGAIFFGEFLDDFPECFLMYANGEGCLKFWKNWKILDLELLKF